jgi:hypothetical protein
LALIIATVVLSLLGALVSDSSESTGPAPPAVPEPAPEHRAEGFFGISPQTDLRGKDYRRMGAGGVSLIRLGWSWDSVQSVPGLCEPEPTVDVCSWTALDAIVGAAAYRGIRILPALGGIPEIFRKPGSEKYIRQHPPTSGEALVAWRAFVRAAAERYGRGGVFWKDFEQNTGREALPIEEWQIWNEPNATSYWPPKPDAREYATLVRETATALREADPEAEVVLGGMFGTATVNSRKYLRTLYSVEGIEEYFDSIAIHPYSPDVHGVKVQTRWLRKTAVQEGDDEVGLWITELGWSTAGGAHPLETGESGQAKRLRRGFELLLRRREAWNIEGVIWFTWKDREDRGVCRFCREAGLFDADARAKRSWDVYKQFARGVQR